MIHYNFEIPITADEFKSTPLYALFTDLTQKNEGLVGFFCRNQEDEVAVWLGGLRELERHDTAIRRKLQETSNLLDTRIDVQIENDYGVGQVSFQQNKVDKPLSSRSLM